MGAFILMFIRECRNVIIALKGDDLGLTHIQIGTVQWLEFRRIVTYLPRFPASLVFSLLSLLGGACASDNVALG